MYIHRFHDDLDIIIKPGKVLVILGPRQVGKSTLLRHYLGGCGLRYRYDTGDDITIRNLLGSENLGKISGYAAGYDLLVIDEAQRIPGIGLGLKMLVDHLPELKVIVTGSSSFELAGQVGEPLTGRKTTLPLYPISHLELAALHTPYELQERLEDHLIFGYYPEVLTSKAREDKISVIVEIANSYLLKDILELDRVKNSKVLLDLLRLMAYQVGSEVSLTEIGGQLGIDSKTVSRYLDLLEKSHVIYNLRGFSRNLRKEVTKKSKFYFYDNGVRNAIIQNFNPLDLRNDVGQLWENFLFMERLKKRTYKGIYANGYFWRTWDHLEIDLVEEREGKLFGYEFKFGTGVAGKKRKPAEVLKRSRVLREWTETYPGATLEVVDRDNYQEFIE